MSRDQETGGDRSRSRIRMGPGWIDGVRERLAGLVLARLGRTLPWRADRDAYRILVSELMLVQTTVTAVIPYFERFLRRFPDIRIARRGG